MPQMHITDQKQNLQILQLILAKLLFSYKLEQNICQEQFKQEIKQPINYITYYHKQNQEMQLPQQVYRWIVSLDIIANEGELGEKGLVQLPATSIVHFQSGYNIAEIVKKILKKSGNNPPACLENVRKDNNKNAKLTNWNFIWISFDDLRMQFDTRIKDLILQGQNALIIQIIKQLCDRDDKKNEKDMKQIVIKDKLSSQRIEKALKNPGKSNSLDIKKINLQKNPDESQSSLQFLILLLSSSLNMTVEQILGLFTNQNKYLAHIIVKGVNDDYGGVLLFYTLLNKHCKKLRQFIENDKKDAQSCLYAIKPGFISKNQQVTNLTLQLFEKLGNIYEWLINQTSRGSTTLLLGVKRHPTLVDSFWELLYKLIQNEDLDFFATYYKQNFKDSKQMIEITNALIRPISGSYVKQKIYEIGIITQWINIALNLFQGPLEDQILTLNFLGQIMLYIPQAINQYQQCLQVFSKGWKQRKITSYILLIDQVLSILNKLAQNRSQFASRIYQIVIQIFSQIYDDKLKKQYLVENFSLLIQAYPKMPSQYFIQAYSQNNLDSTDYKLIKSAVDLSEDVEGLSKIGEVLLRIYNSHAVLNAYLGPLIYKIAKKILNNQIGQAFTLKAIKDCLHAYSIIQTQKKNPQVAKPQPMYFGYKGNSQKLSEQEIDNYKTKQKQSANLLQLVDKLCDLSKNFQLQSLNCQIKDQILDANAYIRKNNFKVGGKGIGALLRKFNISKQDEQSYDQQYRNKKSIANMEQSMARKKSIINNLSAMAASRIGGPQHLKKQFSDIVQKRKKQQEQRKAEQQRKQKQQAARLLQIKKQLQRQQLVRGFGNGQAQLKQQGFWSKILKEDNKQLQLYPPTLMEVKDTDYIQNLFKKYHRITRHLFIKYSASMYSVKSVNNFQDNQIRKQTLNLVQAIKFLKDYKLLFLTNNNQIQNLIRDVNVKLLNKRENQQLDFVGFEHFLVQFSAIIFTKPHTINTKNSKGSENVKKNLSHLSHAQLLQQLFNYIKLVFQQKGEKTTIFDEPEAAYFNQSQVIKQFNKKLQQDPGFILPEGYKKVTEKVINFLPLIGPNVKNGLKSAYIDVLQVLDQIIFQSKLGLHILQPISDKSTKTRVKPQAFGNVKAKLMTDTLVEGKARAMSSAIERKVPAVPPPKMLERKVLSFGMKLGLSYVNYKDKLVGQQVAYLIDDMITAIQNGKTTVQKQKKINQAIRIKNLHEQNQRKNQIQKQKKRKQRKQQLQKIKKQAADKKLKQQQQTKQQRQKKKQKQLQKQKKKKQQTQKYLAQQKAKLKQKKQKQQQQKAKQQEQKKKKKQEQKKAKQKFKQFNEKQLQKLKKNFEETHEQKKKQQQEAINQKKQKDELFKKLRSKISSQDKKIIELRQKNNEQISQLFSSPQIAQILKKFQPNLKGLFDFLIKTTHLSLTQRKHNNEIISQTWNYFNIAFQLNPYIISAKDINAIFKSLTKDKQISKQYYLGLSFQEFEQALLRIAIKHKTIFNKIAEKIKQTDMSEKEIDAVIDKDIQEKEKNQFDQPKEIDVKGLLVEQDINKDVFDDYGEIRKVTPTTLKGLIYYLKVPKDKAGQQKRFRDVLSQKNSYMQKYQKLKEKLKEQYSLQTQSKKKPTTVTQPPKQQENAQPQEQKQPQKQVQKPKQKIKSKK